MGRGTFDVVAAFDPWPYGDTPVFVMTSRPLDTSFDTVRPVSGSIHEVIEEARAEAGDKIVYIDGGSVVRAALDAGLVDRLTLTVIPIVLGDGVPLLAGVSERIPLHLESARPIGGGAVELVYQL